MDNQAAFITNISFPKSLAEVLFYMTGRGTFDIEDLLESDYNEWTVPKDAFIGESVFFMHSVTSIDTIKRLKKELQNAGDEYLPVQKEAIENGLKRGEAIYEEFGGKIFATGKVCNEIIVDEGAREAGLHWSSIYYAPIDSIHRLIKPIDISEFRDFIKISRTGAITKIDDTQLEKLESLIGNHDDSLPSILMVD